MKRVPANRFFLFGIIAGAGFAWDLWSKNSVFSELGSPHGMSAPFFEGWTTFRLYTSFNEGALWGLGQGLTWLFASLSTLAVAGVLYWLFFRGAASSLWLTFSLSLIMAGTLGNLWDRLGLHGHVDAVSGETRFAVRDFLLFTFGDFHWPVFNFADVYLVTGSIMLVLQSITMDVEDEPTAAEQTPSHQTKSVKANTT